MLDVQYCWNRDVKVALKDQPKYKVIEKIWWEPAMYFINSKFIFKSKYLLRVKPLNAEAKQNS